MAHPSKQSIIFQEGLTEKSIRLQCAARRGGRRRKKRRCALEDEQLRGTKLASSSLPISPAQLTFSSKFRRTNDKRNTCNRGPSSLQASSAPPFERSHHHQIQFLILPSILRKEFFPRSIIPCFLRKSDGQELLHSPLIPLERKNNQRVRSNRRSRGLRSSATDSGDVKPL